MHCARESPAPQGRFIRTATANHLVQYARDHRPKAIARLRFEATAFMLAPRQLMKRLAGLLKRRRP
jgi:hypothetical protein